MTKQTVAVLATGGIDSTALLYRAVRRDGLRPTVLTVDYGHRAFARQLELLDLHCNRLGLPLVTIPVTYQPWQADPGLFADTFAPSETDPLADWDALRYRSFFVEGRNLIMVAYALAWCSAHKVDELWAGYLYAAEEWANRRSYKLVTGDNSPHFVDAVNLLTLVGFSHQVRFRAPFYEERLDKRDTTCVARAYGVNVEAETYSCYFVPACGQCDNCLLRRDALEAPCPDHLSSPQS